MNPAREAALFAQALRQPAAERAAWLDRECGDDPALRARLDTHDTQDSLLATCSDDGSVRFWNLATGREVGSWQGTHQTTWAVFSPDGSRLVMVDNTGPARILNAPITPLQDPQPNTP